MSTSLSVPLPPLREFVARRFAVKSPFWSWLLFERAGGALAYVFAKLGFTPSSVTLLGGVSGITGAVVLGTATDVGDQCVAGGLLLLGYTLDCADGQLARATGQTSAKGAWLDLVVDAVIIAFLTTSLAFALAAETPGSPLALVLAGAFGASRTASMVTATRVRASEGGIQLTGLAQVLRTAYGAATDTPFVFALLCATRLHPTAFRVSIAAITVLTAARTIVSAHHHFRAVGSDSVS